MVNEVIGNNDGEMVVVQMGECNDTVEFITNLRDNLENFKLKSSGNSSVSITANSIDFSKNQTTSNTCRVREYTILFTDKVLIRNKVIVAVDCTDLLNHKVLTIKNK